MRKNAVIICCCVLSLLVVSGCRESSENQKDTGASSEQEIQDDGSKDDFIDDEIKNYMSVTDDDLNVTSMLELNGADNTFIFTYDILLSPRMEGSFDIKDGVLTIKPNDKDAQYLFEIEDKDTLKFVKEGSSDLVLSGEEGYEKLLPDQAVFKLEENIMPTKEKVYEMREKALEGMTEQEIKDLSDKVKAANEWLERNWVGEKTLFDSLADPKDVSWNYLEENYDAEDMIGIVQELEGQLKNDLLKADFENLIQDIRQAKETHDVEYVKQAFYIIHDMDYFLLRYGIEDIGRKVQDMSMVSTYYGALEIYHDKE